MRTSDLRPATASGEKARGPHRVAVLLLAGTVPMNVAIPLEAFHRAAELGLPYDVRLCGTEAVVGPFGRWTPAEGLEWAETAHTLVVPGRYDVAAVSHPDVLGLLRRAAARGARLAGMCGGSFVLAEAGVLDGRRATSHWYRTDELRRLHPAVQVESGPLYVQDGPVMTGAGLAAGLDLCVHLVRADHGARAAGRLARVLVVAPHRDGEQAQRVQRPVARRSAGLSGLREWMLDNLHEPVTLRQLARRAGCSERSLLRQFKSETGLPPQQWLTTQRLHAACERLECTDDTVDQVARRTGHGTASNLRRRMLAELGVGPRAYRSGRRAAAH
jgi:transcriptional regulator GlxA family with amidase domain